MSDAADSATWDDLKDLVRWFAVLFGAPSDLLSQNAVKREQAVLIRGWLAGLEAIARALLLMMAAGMPRPDPAPHPAKLQGKARERASGGDRPGVALGVMVPESERWTGVAFTAIPPKRILNDGRDVRRGAPRPATPTRPFALRFEALIRVAEAPERYAARLAKRLFAAPKLAWRVLRAPKPTGRRTYLADDVNGAQTCARFFVTAFKSDTG